MDFSYNSDWNNFVKTECEKLRKKGHTFDAEGTHMKIIGEKYQKKLAREAKAKSKQSQSGGAKSKKQQNNEDIVSCINMMNIASNCCTLSGYVNEVSRCEGIYQEWLVTNPSKANLLHDELIRHQRQVATRKAKSKSDDERKAQKNEAKVKAILEKVRIETEAKAILEKVRIETEAKAMQQREQWDFEARQRDEMLRIRAKQQEELAKVQKEAEAKRIQDIAVAKALQDLLEVREREAKTKEEERIRAVIEAEKHREELEKANARAKEAEELVKAMERDQIAKSNAKAKELEEIVNAANARANEREKIVKSNQEEELKKIKAQLEKEREEFEKFKSSTIERENLAAVNSVSKFAIALQGEIERRKHDKNPIKFKLQRKIKFVSKLEIALKEVLIRRGKIQAS